MAKEKYFRKGDYTFELVTGKKAQDLYDRYHHSNNYYGSRTLWDCYDRPSYAKEGAYDYCMSAMRSFEDYEAWTVIGYNCMQFSFGCRVYDAKTHKHYVLYITKEHNYAIEVVY